MRPVLLGLFFAGALCDCHWGGSTQTDRFGSTRLADTSAPASEYAYTFDPAGLVTSVSANGSSYALTRAGGTLTAGNHTYTFDPLGRVAAIDALAIAYGPDGQIDHANDGAQAVSYVYDENGERILKSVGGAPAAAYTDGVYIVPEELDEPIEVAGRRVGLLRNGVFSLAATDARGTVQADLDGTARIASPFGARDVHSDVAAAADFAAQRFDADLGTDRMGVRDYDARVAMFLEPDPLFLLHPDECVESPVECNLYGYARNRPLDLVDPKGTEGESADAPQAQNAEPTPPETGQSLDQMLGKVEPTSNEELDRVSLAASPKGTEVRKGDIAIDTDGADPRETGDNTGRTETSLHHVNGASFNGVTENYATSPLGSHIPKGTMALVENPATGVWRITPVADRSSHGQGRIEVSQHLAAELGETKLDPNHGGSIQLKVTYFLGTEKQVLNLERVHALVAAQPPAPSKP